MRPTVVCLCGSTRFSNAFRKATLEETLKGKIVLTIGCDMRSDTNVFGSMSEEELREKKAMLDVLHFRKIDLSDEVLILNVGGYIGQSTYRELLYSMAAGKDIRFLKGIHPNSLDMAAMESRLLGRLGVEAKAIFAAQEDDLPV